MLTLTEKIVDRWVANGRTKAELAMVVAMHPTNVTHFANGRQHFRLNQVTRVAEACGMTTAQFITHIEEGTWPAPAE